jgi:predicted nucleic acid-binding protein
LHKLIIISDTGPIFSLASVDQLVLLTKFFDHIMIPKAVWLEIEKYSHLPYYERMHHFFEKRVRNVKENNLLSMIMDDGEAEAVLLCKEVNADFLLIDDKKARSIAEHFGINCIGTIGLLVKAKESDFIKELRPVFIQLLKHKRYYAISLLNGVLQKYGEASISQTI